jgi:opacity protein-like surface antigen
MKSWKVYLLLGSCLLLSTTGYAEEQVSTNIIEFTVKSGYTDFTDERNLKGSPHAGAGLGLHMTPNWLFMLGYSSTHTEDTKTKQDDIWVRYYSLESLYFFVPDKPIRPYLTFGFGEMEIRGQTTADGGVDSSDYLWRYGVGLQYTINRQWALRGDYQALRSHDLNSNNYSSNLTLAYRFGGGGY